MAARENEARILEACHFEDTGQVSLRTLETCIFENFGHVSLRTLDKTLSELWKRLFENSGQDSF